MTLSILSTWLVPAAVMVCYLSLCFGFSTSQRPWGVAVGEDGRVSTSKFQFFVWTGVVIFCYSMLFTCALTSGTNPFAINLDAPNLMLAMGFSVITLATAKGITTSYVNIGRVTRVAANQARFRDIFLTDDGLSPDLVKVQMVVWTFISAATYVVQFLVSIHFGSAHLSDRPELRDLDPQMLVLMGISQGGYLGFKIVSSTTMVFNNVVPPSAPAGAVVTLNGKNFGTTTGSVYIGDVVADIKSWSDTAIDVFVPMKNAHGQPLSGTVNVAVLIQGATPDVRQTSAGVAFTVLGMGITAVAPDKPAVNTPATISGFGFGPAPGGNVYFSDAEATVTRWTDTQIVATVPTADKSGNSLVGKAVDLTVLTQTHAVAIRPALQLGP